MENYSASLIFICFTIVWDTDSSTMSSFIIFYMYYLLFQRFIEIQSYLKTSVDMYLLNSCCGVLFFI